MVCKVISLADFRKTRKAQSRILRRLIERHLTEAGRFVSPSDASAGEEQGYLREGAEE